MSDAPPADPSLLALLPDVAAGLAAAPRGFAGIAVAGICGAQGSGKTTMALHLERELLKLGKRAVTLSLDDFYLPKADRHRLARDVHPLCATRGVPGTHDMGLYAHTVDRLAQAHARDETPLPIFSKLDDDRLPPDQWVRYVGRPDIILFEGWCVGAKPQPDSAWGGPSNALERAEDRDGIWWRWWNAALAKEYWPVWGDLTPQILIRVPGIESVVRSRLKQERGLASADPEKPSMDEAAVRRFVAHYERLTLRIWDEMPDRAHLVLDRDDSFAFSIAKSMG